MKLTSSAFEHNGAIPRRHTCQGADVSPELTIEGIPDGARSLALIMEDPDAPGRTFDHWIVYDMPADTGTIGEGTAPGTQGRNGFGKTAYGGPCPPSGTHRYFFKLYALDRRLDLPSGSRKRDLQEAMADHILDQAELVGRYAKG
jgi:Raf kinase inhibitor-like YbhB/YbcL family protein